MNDWQRIGKTEMLRAGTEREKKAGARSTRTPRLTTPPPPISSSASRPRPPPISSASLPGPAALAAAGPHPPPPVLELAVTRPARLTDLRGDAYVLTLHLPSPAAEAREVAEGGGSGGGAGEGGG